MAKGGEKLDERKRERESRKLSAVQSGVPAQKEREENWDVRTPATLPFSFGRAAADSEAGTAAELKLTESESGHGVGLDQPLCLTGRFV